ncbi:MAG: RecX family transcriptional regulator [Planctomycetota bacterium]
MKTITSLETQKGNPSRVNVFLNNRYAFAVRLIDAAVLKQGQALSQEEISRLKKADDRYKAYRAAIYFLAYRARSQTETERHLNRKGFSSEIVNQTIERLRSQKYLDDLEFSQARIKSRMRRKPASKSVLRFELNQKGIDEKIIEKVLVDVDNGELARNCVEKKLRLWGNLGRKDFKKKILNYLKRRGFNYEVSLNAYRHAWSILNNRNRPSLDDRDQTLNRKY